jgi:hypothetical protein
MLRYVLFRIYRETRFRAASLVLFR